MPDQDTAVHKPSRESKINHPNTHRITERFVAKLLFIYLNLSTFFVTRPLDRHLETVQTIFSVGSKV